MRRLTAIMGALCILAGGGSGRGDTGPGCPPGGTQLSWEDFGIQFFEKNCNRCHEYESYGTVYGLRAEILDLVLDGNMPPLTPVPDEERSLLAEWVSCGLPRNGSGTPFRRGDANGDGVLDVSDGITVLLYLFAEGEAGCLDALDADANLTLEVTDAIAVLRYHVLEGPPLPQPFEACGVADAGIGCAGHGGCARE